MDRIPLGGLVRRLSELGEQRARGLFVAGLKVEAELFLHALNRDLLRPIEPSALLTLSQALACGSNIRNRTHLFEVSSSRIAGQEQQSMLAKL